MKRTILAAFAAALMLPALLPAQTPGPVSPGEAGSIIGSGLGSMSAKETGSGILKWFGDIMGMEVGTIMINGVNYSKLTLTPEIRIGRLKLGLYLPVIYTTNIFDPSDWYHPEGNDEWSFGGEYWQTDPYTATLDALSDVALKIKYLEYGEQLIDPFFVKIGNLDSLTIGHGLLMSNYRNNTEFPAVRKVGFNTGIDLGGAGFEALVNDLAHPRLFGARLYVRPIRNFKLAFGASAVLDTNPGRDLITPLNDVGNMMFLGGGLDADLPIIQAGAFFTLRAYAGVAATVPWVRDAFVGPSATIQPGLKWDLVWNNGKPTNWGASTGLMGNILFLKWKAEYRYFTGLFKTSFFDSLYERNSGVEALNYVPYLDGTKSIGNAPTFSGIFGEAGFDIFKDKLVFTVGYLWPFTPGLPITASSVLENDKLEASLRVKKGFIPLIDVSGNVYYTRRMFAKSILDGDFAFFDTNSILAGELVVPVPKTPNLDVAFIFQTVVVRDTEGFVVYVVPHDPTSGVKVKPSIGIETRYHF